MYERYGIEGMKAYAKTCEYAKAKGLIVIGDIKRSDMLQLQRLMLMVILVE